METEALQAVVKLAGIGGVALLVLWFVYRAVIGKDIFPKLSRTQSVGLLRWITGLTFITAIAGLGAYVYLTTPRAKLYNPQVTMDEKVRFIIKVLDKKTGTAIGGAKVSLEARGLSAVDTTDSEGVVSFPVVDPTEELRIRVEASGYEPGFNLRVTPSNTPRGQEVRLTPLATDTTRTPEPPRPTPTLPSPPTPGARPVAVVTPPATSTTRTPEPPRPTPTLPSPPRPTQPPYIGPSSGIIEWNGVLEANKTIDLGGRLPGVAVAIESIEPQYCVDFRKPSFSNKWKQLGIRCEKKVNGVITVRWHIN